MSSHGDHAESLSSHNCRFDIRIAADFKISFARLFVLLLECVWKDGPGIGSDPELATAAGSRGRAHKDRS